MRDRLVLNSGYAAHGPPSYQAAAYRQVLWKLVAPYVDPHDLPSACLVSRQWHDTFSPNLWGSPAARFGVESDAVYLSLTRFKRLLRRVRLDVRRLVHTLHLPPAQPELYDGPQAGWLRDLLDRLPSLQALIVSKLSFFDHQTLQSIHQVSGTPRCNLTTYTLRLLIASECENTTASSLNTALSHFPDLIYLDLSCTQGSRSPYVLHQISLLSELRVLKLRACGLRDDDIDYLTFSKHLRSLDVSQNLLSERGVSKVVDLLPISSVQSGGNLHGERPIITRRYSGTDLPTRVSNEGLENFVVRELTGKPDGHLSLEEGLPSYFSHLYLAGNHITVDGLCRLLDYPMLQHLDCGSLNCSSRPFELPSPMSPGANFKKFSYQSEPEVIRPALFIQAFRNIQSLRTHISIITSNPFSRTEIAAEQQCFELHSEDLRFELDSTEIKPQETLFELDNTSTDFFKEPGITCGENSNAHATFESPDDVGSTIEHILSVRMEGDNHNGMASVPYASCKQRKTRREPLSPQISVSLPKDSNISLPSGPQQYKDRDNVGPDQRWSQISDGTGRLSSIEEVLEEAKLRRHRTEARERHPGRFKPSMLPNLKILALTDIPSLSRQRETTKALVTFIQEWAEEEELARLEDLVQQRRQALGIQPSKRLENSMLKLQRLILEVSPTCTSDLNITSSSPLRAPNSPHSHSYPHPRPYLSGISSKSSPVDHGSETLMLASSTDFSFFDEDDGGLLTSDGRIDAPGKVDQGMLVTEEGQVGRMQDVVGELARWRRETRRLWEGKMRANERMGVRADAESVLLGHWRGEVKVVKEVREA